MSEKLLPCPFCGGEAIANSDEIECAKCCAQGPLGEFRWQEWNKREKSIIPAGPKTVGRFAAKVILLLRVAKSAFDVKAAPITFI